MRLFKYLGEHKAAMALVVVLLIGLAYTDLSLPRLTSNIVDVGIQQSGVEHVAVEEMSERTYEISLALTSLEDEELVKRSYTETEGGTYKLNEEGRMQIESLDAALAVPMIAANALPDEGGVNVDQLASAYQAGLVDKGQILEAVDRMLASAGGVSETIIEQQGVAAAKTELENLGYDLAAVQMGYLLRTGGLMALLALVGMALNVGVGFIAARTGAKIGRDLRSRLFSRVMAFSEGEIVRFSAASLITRGTNDIQLIQMVCILLMRMVLYAPILAIGGIVMVTTTDASMGWIIVVAIVVVFAVVGVLFAVALPKFRMMQKLIDRVNLVAREMLTGLSVVRAFDREEYEEARFDKASTDLMRTQLFTNRVMTFMMPAMMLVMNAVSVAIVWFGGAAIDAGTMQTGDMIAFITYSMVIIMSFLMLSMLAIMLPRAAVAAGRIDEVLECEPAISDSPVSAACDATRIPSSGESGSSVTPGACVSFNDVSFSYDKGSENVLDHVSFTAKPGETLAIIGATGSGKSTIVKLIERFYDVTSGSVTFDGVDIRDMPLHELRAQIGYVPQKAFLFSGTVESNIAYAASDLSEGDLARALEIACASEFVAGMKGTTQAEISQGGTNVSGGQRQRLAIARAVARNARLFIFDDSFSALDYRTDAALRHALEVELGDVTRIIVAQRISTIMHADTIVVIDEGRVSGVGTHEQLMRNCPEYREIAFSQLSKEELSTGGDAA